MYDENSAVCICFKFNNLTKNPLHFKSVNLIIYSKLYGKFPSFYKKLYCKSLKIKASIFDQIVKKSLLKFKKKSAVGLQYSVGIAFWQHCSSCFTNY